ncbi:D-alanyl-lipoteichoic acid biosynthesis protein DltD [Lactobacillus crispatus]|uniref:D-alanyl-lipoteichoic acid biosynthesis protein DltD n=1 Tax=Lactobacillus crispatus TaxID=47770 RepID=UPI00336A5835
MSNKKKLWNIFGPVIIAFLLFGCVLLLPMKRHFSNKNLYEAATSQNENVFKGIKLKQQAFKKNYVPFYGSSELSRIDPLHPSIIAKKYHRNYRPFLLGSRGTESLLQYMDMQGTAKQLRNKKAVVIISPMVYRGRSKSPSIRNVLLSIADYNFLATR